jgi:cell division protein FtsQ
VKRDSLLDQQLVNPVRKLKRGLKPRSNLLVVSPRHKWRGFLSNRVKRDRQKGFSPLKRTLGQLGFGLLKIFLFLLVLGVLSLIFISGYQFLSSSPYFRLHNIVLTGVNDDLREEVIKISGLRKRESLLSIDPVTIKGNIEAHPWIKSVFLKKEFPHTLYIKAETQDAVAIVLIGQMCFMDREGVIFKEVERDEPVDLPVVTGLSPGDKANGAYLKEVASFLNALYLMDTPLSVERLSEIHVEEDGTLAIYFNKLPFKVFLGGDDFIRKIDSLTHIIKHLRATHRLYQVRSIDLGYSDRAVVAFTGRVV